MWHLLESNGTGLPLEEVSRATQNEIKVGLFRHPEGTYKTNKSYRIRSDLVT